MSCPGPEHIAAAVAGEDRATAAHVLGCPACRVQFDEQSALRRQLGALSAAPLTAQTRDRLAAGVLARLDSLPAALPGRRSFARSVRWVGLAAAALALAVLGVELVTRGAPDPGAPVARSTPPAPARAPVVRVPAPAIPRITAEPAPAVALRSREAPTSPHAVSAARLSGTGARFGRITRAGRDIVDLQDGELTVDARTTAPVEIRLGATAIHVANARMTVTARTGVLATVTVFAGSVELSSGARSQVVTAGTLWEAPAEAPRSDRSATLSAASAASLGEFRAGWTALRQRQFAAAIAAFDRATDPVVQEDAVYWAAIAASRMGDRGAARRRFAEFLTRFPESPRIDAARRALDAVPP